MLIIFFIIVIILIYLFLIFPTTRKHPFRYKLNELYVAHRGLHSLENGLPENSLPAFEKAIENNFAIENDIHLTKDGKVVVFHDNNLKRVCGVDKIIEDMDYEQLSKLRLFDTDCKIPLLEDYLKTVDGKVLSVIEFKCTPKNYIPLCEAANKILERYNGEYIIQSFNPFVLYWYRKNKPSVFRGQLSQSFIKRKNNPPFTQILLGLFLYNFLSRPDYVAYNFEHTKSISRRLCVLFGAVSAGWTFRSPNELEKYKKYYQIRIFEKFVP